MCHGRLSHSLMRIPTILLNCALALACFQYQLGGSYAQDVHSEVFQGDLDALYGFMLSKSTEGDAIPQTQKGSHAKSMFDRWLHRVVSDSFAPMSEIEYKCFRKAFRNRDVIVGRWAHSGIQFQCAQTADLFVISVHAPNMRDEILETILRDDADLWGEGLEQIRFPYFGLYMLNLIGSPQKQLKSKHAVEMWALGNEGIGDFANRALAGKLDISEIIFSKRLLEDDSSWYRNMFLLKDVMNWTLAFPKYEAGASISPGEIAVRNDWF